MDLIEESRVNLKYLLVLVDRRTKLTIIRLINDKKSQTINSELRILQKAGRMVFGYNCFSITTDNGSEFWG